MKTTVLLLILFTLFMLNTFAQDSPQWHLPDGAKARLGKGAISGNIAHSPDGTRLAVSGGIGIWIYDTEAYQESALLTGHRREVENLAFSPDGNTIASANWYTVRVWDATTGAHKHTTHRAWECVHKRGVQSRWKHTRKWERRQKGAAVGGNNRRA